MSDYSDRYLKARQIFRRHYGVQNVNDEKAINEINNLERKFQKGTLDDRGEAVYAELQLAGYVKS